MNKKLQTILTTVFLACLIIININTYAKPNGIGDKEPKENESGGGGSDFAFQKNKEVKNVNCVKEISITGAGGGTTKFGYRDKCKSKGSGCRPTRCL